MDNLAYKLEKYSYEDLLTMADDNRYEIIDGELYLMSSPRVIHQEILGEVFIQLKQFFKDKKCRPFLSPLDVRISGEKQKNREYNVVQPDAFVICDENKVDEKGICGAPDFIIEIVSPGNVSYDKIDKFKLYQKYGVKEYWIISPMEKLINCYTLNKNQEYVAQNYKIEEEIKSSIFKGLTICLKEVCEKNKQLLDEEK